MTKLFVEKVEGSAKRISKNGSRKTEPGDIVRLAPPGIYGKRAEIVDGKKRFVSRMLFEFSADLQLECLRISSSDKSGKKLKKYLRELLVKSGVRLTKHEKQIFGVK